jgi:threonylcarbamoyladenosine tRNA methylthiotransferase MtaB
VPELPRLRLSSLDPVEVDDALLDAIAAEDRLMPHFHLSIQAGDDLVLKRMKRRHGRRDAIAICDRIRRLRPDAVFGADLIAGFPTETEAMFANTLRLVEEAGLTWLHVFPYSGRPGTPAARMPQVPVAERRARAARLRALGAGRRDTFLDGRIGRMVRVLVEKDGAGRCEHYAPVAIAGGAAEGAIVAARVLRRDRDRLEAAPAA